MSRPAATTPLLSSTWRPGRKSRGFRSDRRRSGTPRRFYRRIDRLKASSRDGRPRGSMTTWTSTPTPVGESPWAFPPASQWPEDEVIAIGADLDAATLIAAYRCGLFPMELHGARGLIGWWAPNPRGILPLDALRVTRSMKQSARQF